jgi:hypothetical protein
MGIAVVLFVLIGNPASGNGSAPELLPDFWRAIGQLMPPGAGGTSLRNTAYFDGNAVAGPLVVLSAFVAAGAALILIAETLHRRREQAACEGQAAPSRKRSPVAQQPA